MLSPRGRWENAKEINPQSSVFVCDLLCFGLQKYKMNFDKNTGVIELIMESLTPADEGTFTFQLQDGKATNQSSLVLIGDGMFS